MTINNPSFQLRNFMELQIEVRDALQANDPETARLALYEIECLWMHTDWPRMRQAAADFLRNHLNHAELTEFVA